MSSLSKRETAERLGISQRTLTRRFPDLKIFPEDWVEQMVKVTNLRRRVDSNIKSLKDARREVRNIIKKKIK